MLGVRREGVTQAAVKLQELGEISYSRGLIKVLDRPKLETLSCECYGVVRKKMDLLLDDVPQPAHQNGASGGIRILTPGRSSPPRGMTPGLASMMALTAAVVALP